MLDVHPPDEAVHNWRDFLLHIVTMTIGLFIALSLEGCVEWNHHRHLVHEAEESLQHEIQSNAKGLQDTVADIHKQQEFLKKDIAVLKYIVANRTAPKGASLEINFHIRSFDDLSWKTAQSTGALSYMSYGEAQEYADIYHTQEEVDVVQHQAARDAIVSSAPFMNTTDQDGVPSVEEAKSVKEHIEILQGQLMLLNSLVTSLDGEYKRFLTAHHG